MLIPIDPPTYDAVELLSEALWLGWMMSDQLTEHQMCLVCHAMAHLGKTGDIGLIDTDDDLVVC